MTKRRRERTNGRRKTPRRRRYREISEEDGGPVGGILSMSDEGWVGSETNKEGIATKPQEYTMLF